MTSPSCLGPLTLLSSQVCDLDVLVEACDFAVSRVCDLAVLVEAYNFADSRVCDLAVLVETYDFAVSRVCDLAVLLGPHDLSCPAELVGLRCGWACTTLSPADTAADVL